MRRRRRIFWDSIVALTISWGTAYYFKQEAEEVFFPLASTLALLCLLILIPVSLRHLSPGKPLRRGLSFAIGLSPLLVLLAHPRFFLDPFNPLWLELGLGNDYTWLIKSLLNFFIFFCCGYLFSRNVPQDKVTWSRSFLVLLCLMILYAGLLYGGIELFRQYPSL